MEKVSVSCTDLAQSLANQKYYKASSNAHITQQNTATRKRLVKKNKNKNTDDRFFTYKTRKNYANRGT